MPFSITRNKPKPKSTRFTLFLMDENHKKHSKKQKQTKSALQIRREICWRAKAVLDEDSLHLSTPDAVANEQAKIVSYLSNHKTLKVVDGFAGAGINAVHFAMYKSIKQIIAIDILQKRLNLLKLNCKAYGIQKSSKTVQVLNYNFLDYLNESFSIKKKCKRKDLVFFLSPPWGGNNYMKTIKKTKQRNNFDLKKDMPLQSDSGEKISLFEVFKRCLKLTSNVVLFLPRHTRRDQLEQLGSCFVRQHWRKNEYIQTRPDILTRCIGISVFYGGLNMAAKEYYQKL